ncbi:MAG: hybrid sensor histidine kinase/response regulator, partial [Pseudomonadota bacterium]
MRDWTIRNRVLFVALVPLVLIVLLLSVHFTYTRLAEIERSLNERGGAIVRQLAPACEYGVVSGNAAFLTGLSTAALREQDVSAVLITDRRNQLLARVNSAAAPSIVPEDVEAA